MTSDDLNILAWCVLDAKRRMHACDRAELLAEVAAGRMSLADADEQQTDPPSQIFESELRAFVQSRLSWARDIRAYVETHSGSWKPHVRERWLADVELIEADCVSDLARANWADEELGNRERVVIEPDPEQRAAK